MSSSSYNPMAQTFGMSATPGNISNMASMRQDSVGESNPPLFTSKRETSATLGSFEYNFVVSMGEDDWYNKSLSALRMNSNSHGLSSSMLPYQS